LGSEASRWEMRAKRLEEDLKNLTGNILLAAACIAYIGPFSSEYREEMVNNWTKSCK